MSITNILIYIAWPLCLFGIFYNNSPKSPHSYQQVHTKKHDAPSDQVVVLNLTGVIVPLIGFLTGNLKLSLGVFLPALILSIFNLKTIFKLRNAFANNHHNND